MPTDEERCEVATKLRKIVGYSSRDIIEKIQETCGCNTGLVWEDVMEFKNRLADLIEPEPKRTCKMELVKNGSIYSVWRFSCCGYEYSENNTDSGATELPGTRCPKCGTVVDDDR